MPALSIQPTYPIFTDIDGQPLENGYVWIGTANLDPQTNPINVYWDDALTQLAAQPIRTRGGYPVNAGTPARLYVNSDYSIRVTNKNGAAIYNAPEATERISNAIISQIDSSLVNYTPAGTGAVATTVQNKLREFVSVKDFGASASASAAVNTAAIQAACAAAKTITFGSSADNYSVSGTITLNSGTFLLMNGATITQTQDQTPIFNASNTDNVTITNGRFVGKSEASYTNSSSSQAIAIRAENATDLLVSGNIFENFWYSPLMVSSGGNRIEFSSNTIKGPGSAVLGVDVNRRNTTGCTVIGSNLRVTNNDIYDTAQGIIIGQGSTDIIIEGNVIHDLINEHGIYADTGLRRLTIANNVIRNTGAAGTGLKVQCYDSFGVQPQCIAITANVISNTGASGILIQNTTVSPTLATLDVTISGNSIQNAGAYAIDVRDAQDCSVVGNTIVTPLQSGISWGNCTGLLIADNYVRGSATSGMRDVSQSSNITIKNNVVVNCATANTAGDKFGILLAGGATNCVIYGNAIFDANANMQYGIYVVPALNSTLSIVNNLVAQATDTGLRLGSTAALREYRNNNWNGSLAATFNDPVLPVVASATPTITLPTGHNIVSISGTSTIQEIKANGHSGRTVTLVFQGALTVQDAAYNIKLNGNFVTTADDTLTIVSDGTYWYEVARSAN